MLKNYLHILFILSFTYLYSQNTYVPDDNFEQVLIDKGLDDVLDDYVTTANIASVTSLDVSNKDIGDLTGIDGFGNLNYLNCNFNKLTSLDLSQNIALINLTCSFNQLKNLDVSNSPSLTSIGCSFNELTSLDVRNNLALTSLSCVLNGIFNLDLSKNVKLKELYFTNNSASSIDVSNNLDLKTLNVLGNRLTSLDVSKNVILEQLDCGYNNLLSLDLSKNTLLKILGFDSNKLVNINILNCPVLYGFSGADNLLTSVDFSNNPDLEYLFIWDNKLTSLDVSNNLVLTSLECYNNPDLLCIQVNNETDANYGIGVYTDWIKDEIATYSEDCSTYLGVDDELLAEGLNVYPNPVYNTLLIESKLPLTKIEIYSILGQKVKTINSDFNSISTDNLSRGIYLIKIYSEKGATVRKLIKH